MHTARFFPLLLLASVSACAPTHAARPILQPTSREQPLESTTVVRRAPTAAEERVTMLAERRRRALLRGARAYGRDVLAASEGITVADFLRRRLPGGEMGDPGMATGRLPLRGCPTQPDLVVVYVDGGRIPETANVLRSFAAADLALIEVYQGVAELPLEVKQGCAAIFLWTVR